VCCITEYAVSKTKPGRISQERYKQDFRKQLVGALLAMGRASDISPKKEISRISQGANQVPVQSHEKANMQKRGKCMCCKGLRLGDWPKKRVTLGDIAANKGRESIKHDSRYKCKQCDVYLCNSTVCFDLFYRGVGRIEAF
jgi:DDE_Tnp_1-like zinc-ribbon